METTKKPTTIKWINGLLLFRLLILVVTIIITTFVLFLNPEEGFFTGFAHPILSNSGIYRPFDSPAYTAGFLAGRLLITIILCILEYILLNRKKRIGFWVVFGFDFFLTIALHISIFIPIVILILGLMKSSRDYFMSKTLSPVPADIYKPD